MTSAFKPPKAVIFDAYGTLLDVYCVTERAETWLPGHGRRLAQIWRDKQIEYTRLLTTCDAGVHYEDFWSVTQKALRYAIEYVAVCADSAGEKSSFNYKNEEMMSLAVKDLMAQYRQLNAFEECQEVLLKLRRQGVITGVLSNGEPSMLHAGLESAGLAPFIDHLMSVDKIRLYKTHPKAYALAVQATSLSPDQMLFVSSNGWDALAAAWFGYSTLWVNRHGLPEETIGPNPTRTGSNLRAVFDFFD